MNVEKAVDGADIEADCFNAICADRRFPLSIKGPNQKTINDGEAVTVERTLSRKLVHVKTSSQPW